MSAAEGGDKLARAHSLATHLAKPLHADVSRVVGRVYPNEDTARFAFGVRWREGRTSGGTIAPLDSVPVPPPTELPGDHWLPGTPDPGVVHVHMAPRASA